MNIGPNSKEEARKLFNKPSLISLPVIMLLLKHYYKRDVNMPTIDLLRGFIEEYNGIPQHIHRLVYAYDTNLLLHGLTIRGLSSQIMVKNTDYWIYKMTGWATIATGLNATNYDHEMFQQRLPTNKILIAKGVIKVNKNTNQITDINIKKLEEDKTEMYYKLW